MILIISSPEDDSTADVMDWLGSYGLSVKRLHLQGEEFFFENDLNANELTAVWFRRGRVGDGALNNLPLDGLRILGNHRRMSVDKVWVLHLAKEIGLAVPDHAQLDNLSDAHGFYQKHGGQVVIKTAEEAAVIRDSSGGVWAAYTERVTPEMMGTWPERFVKTLFQEAVHKLADIRVFYLLGQCYAMAVFGPENDGAVDVRIAQSAHQTRNVPFRMPDELCLKIKLLMETLDLNTASLDFILTPQRELLFLEVNPVGQFGMVSKSCWYHLEEKIARYLAYGETPSAPY